jgi:2-polyprenyl-3-methyl-5-hydroxy-6-metoxy-1,4-benzoquinol methylase
MLLKLKTIIERHRDVSVIKAALTPYYTLRYTLWHIWAAMCKPITVIYWWMVKRIVMSWGEKGLHSISIGEILSGKQKTRSLYREDMLLKTIILFVDLRGKSCIDLACNDGFWSFRLGRFGIKRLFGVDLAEMMIHRANFLKTVYNFPRFQFQNKDILQFLYHDNRETYDIVLLLSIIYHLPEETDWNKFFNTIYGINNECLIIDSRWFDDHEYYYDTTSEQAIIKTKDGITRKWRPTRSEVFSCLYKSGYEQVIEINPSAFLKDEKEAYGDGDPYTLTNVSDYISNNRTLVISYKEKSMVPNVEKRLSFKYV